MDGVSWSTTRTPESFSRSPTATETLSRLASFIARSDTKQPAHNPRQRSSHLHAYVCPECGKSFPYATDLLLHQELKHSLPKPHRCPSCGQEFSLRSSLQLHKCDRDSSPCELCCGGSRSGSPCPSCMHHASDPGRPQENSLHLKPHLLDSSPYACAPCGRGFSQKKALLQHQQAGCSEPPSPSDGVDASSLPDYSPPVSEADTTRSDSSDAPGPTSRAVRVCQFCSRSFRTAAGLQRHKQCNHSEEQLRAPKRQKTKGEMGKEGDDNEDPNKNSKSKKKLLKCRSCDMIFMSTSKLHMHRTEKHSREKSTRRDPKPVVKRRWKGHGNPCQVCGKVFFHHLSLKAHYRLHTASGFSSIDNKGRSEGSTAKDYKLPENRPNNLKANLKGTTVKPGRGRPRKVPILEIKKSDLRRCKKVPEVKEGEAEDDEEEEEEEREYPCPSCAEVFSLQSKLWEHMELHQSCVKRRHCSVCTNEMDTCKWPGSKKHRLYHCVPCQQGFSAMDSFLEHCQEHLRVRVEEDSLTEAYMQQASKA